jgi:hypothetical protein
LRDGVPFGLGELASGIRNAVDEQKQIVHLADPEQAGDRACRTRIAAGRKPLQIAVDGVPGTTEETTAPRAEAALAADHGAQVRASPAVVV